MKWCLPLFPPMPLRAIGLSMKPFSKQSDYGSNGIITDSSSPFALWFWGKGVDEICLSVSVLPPPIFPHSSSKSLPCSQRHSVLLILVSPLVSWRLEGQGDIFYFRRTWVCLVDVSKLCTDIIQSELEVTEVKYFLKKDLFWNNLALLA